MAVLLGSDNAFDRAFAERLDQEDPLKHLRDQFIIPSKADLKRKTLNKSSESRPVPGSRSYHLTRGSQLTMAMRPTLQAYTFVAIRSAYNHIVSPSASMYISQRGQQKEC